MYARIVEATAVPGKREEIWAVLAHELLPFTETQQGFVDALRLSSENDFNMNISLTLWKTREDLERYLATSEYKSVLSRLRPLFRTYNARIFHVDSSTCHRMSLVAAA